MNPDIESVMDAIHRMDRLAVPDWHGYAVAVISPQTYAELLMNSYKSGRDPFPKDGTVPLFGLRTVVSTEEPEGVQIRMSVAQFEAVIEREKRVEVFRWEPPAPPVTLRALVKKWFKR